MEKKWQATKEYFLDYERFTRPFSVNLETAIRGFDIDNIAAQKAIDESKALHVDGRPRKAPTASKNMSSVMVETSMRMLGPPPPTLSIIPRIGLMTIPWVTDFFWRGAGHMVSVHYLEEFDM